MTARAPLHSLYLALSHLGDLPYRILQRRRLRAGKEDPARLGERKGVPGRTRPEGPLVWFHAASVGETQALLRLISRLLGDHPGLHVLVTSTTLTSARLLARDLPEGAVHQFPPFDTPRAVRAFLAHWRPDVAVFAESELWPRLLAETRAAGIPLLLANARVSERTAARWRRWPRTARALLDPFDAIFAQEEATAGLMRDLGVPSERIAVTGSLKEDVPALPADPAAMGMLRAALRGRDAWCAASTHPGEDDLVLAAHGRAFGRSDRAPLLILVPRHPERGPDVLALAEEGGWRAVLRSDTPAPPPGTQVYIADTMGEMGLWYRLCPVSFVGGSLVAIGGHNPFEPVQLGSAVIHGPHVFNFKDIYRRLGAAGGAVKVTDAPGLADALGLMLDVTTRTEIAEKARAALSASGEATERTAAAISERLSR